MIAREFDAGQVYRYHELGSDRSFCHPIQVIWEPLRLAKTPLELLTAIFHAMLGHFNMWWDYGNLHRDVGASNLIITQPRRCIQEAYYPPTHPMVENFKGQDVTCVGLLIDGDLARRTDNTGQAKTIGKYASMSRRLHQALRGHGGPITHSPIDDIESSVWSLTWVLYEQACKVELKDSFTPDQRDAMEALRSENPTEIHVAKRVLSSVPGKIFPQCFQLDSFISETLKLCGSLIGRSTVSENEALFIYLPELF
ncbi:hypothetical protein DL93DRAFT_1868158 [Clavulina sp. PMI_390]|nr:hypothetical protein DL93DRAFT_1868158 [Clavulina sp. PMI_390]